jgi:CDP-diacylglycerol--serine O-phosphatidyltransferase
MAARRRLRGLDLRKTLFLLPNMITLSSIFCGFDSMRIAATARSDDDYNAAAVLLVFAMIFDMLDGRVARMTRTQSAFGLQIDSLADVVSFGAAPALLVYQWSLNSLGTPGLLAAFVFMACGAIRLARFNVLSMGEQGQPARPSKYIVGLPIPGAAGVLISIVVANHAAAADLHSPGRAWAILAVTIVLSFFMVSTIQFRSFKDVRLNGRTAAVVAFTLASSALVLATFKPAFVLVWLLSVYLLLGVVESTAQLLRRRSRVSRQSTPPSIDLGRVWFVRARAHPAKLVPVRCPTCHGPSSTDAAQNPSRPFCSPRCKLIDFSKWIDGSYAIPGPPVDGESSTDSDAGKDGEKP